MCWENPVGKIAQLETRSNSYSGHVLPKDTDNILCFKSWISSGIHSYLLCFRGRLIIWEGCYKTLTGEILTA